MYGYTWSDTLDNKMIQQINIYQISDQVMVRYPKLFFGETGYYGYLAITASEI